MPEFLPFFLVVDFNPILDKIVVLFIPNVFSFVPFSCICVEKNYGMVINGHKNHFKVCVCVCVSDKIVYDIFITFLKQTKGILLQKKLILCVRPRK